MVKLLNPDFKRIAAGLTPVSGEEVKQIRKTGRRIISKGIEA